MLLVEICGGFAGRLTGPGLMVTFTGTVTLTGPAPTVTTLGEPPGWSLVRVPSARQLATNTTPKATPPRTNAQKAATANTGGCERPGPGLTHRGRTRAH